MRQRWMSLVACALCAVATSAEVFYRLEITLEDKVYEAVMYQEQDADTVAAAFVQEQGLENAHVAVIAEAFRKLRGEGTLRVPVTLNGESRELVTGLTPAAVEAAVMDFSTLHGLNLPDMNRLLEHTLNIVRENKAAASSPSQPPPPMEEEEEKEGKAAAVATETAVQATANAEAEARAAAEAAMAEAAEALAAEVAAAAEAEERAAAEMLAAEAATGEAAAEAVAKAATDAASAQAVAAAETSTAAAEAAQTAAATDAEATAAAAQISSAAAANDAGEMILASLVVAVDGKDVVIEQHANETAEAAGAAFAARFGLGRDAAAAVAEQLKQQHSTVDECAAAAAAAATTTAATADAAAGTAADTIAAAAAAVAVPAAHAAAATLADDAADATATAARDAADAAGADDAHQLLLDSLPDDLPLDGVSVNLLVNGRPAPLRLRRGERVDEAARRYCEALGSAGMDHVGFVVAETRRTIIAAVEEERRRAAAATAGAATVSVASLTVTVPQSDGAFAGNESDDTSLAKQQRDAEATALAAEVVAAILSASSTTPPAAASSFAVAVTSPGLGSRILQWGGQTLRPLPLWPLLRQYYDVICVAGLLAVAALLVSAWRTFAAGRRRRRRAHLSGRAPRPLGLRAALRKTVRNAVISWIRGGNSDGGGKYDGAGGAGGEREEWAGSGSRKRSISPAEAGRPEVAATDGDSGRHAGSDGGVAVDAAAGKAASAAAPVHGAASGPDTAGGTAAKATAAGTTTTAGTAMTAGAAVSAAAVAAFTWKAWLEVETRKPGAPFPQLCALSPTGVVLAKSAAFSLEPHEACSLVRLTRSKAPEGVVGGRRMGVAARDAALLILTPRDGDGLKVLATRSRTAVVVGCYGGELSKNEARAAAEAVVARLAAVKR